MIRTLINLDEKDKAWLAGKARREHRPMSAVMRQAIRELRERESGDSRARRFFESGEKLKGTWKEGDGLSWQLKLRNEWTR